MGHPVEQELVGRLREWSERNGWRTVEEAANGSVEAHDLVIDTNGGRLLVEVKRTESPHQHRIDLEAYPSLFRVRLVRNDEEADWRILTDSGIYIRKPLNEETFTEIATDLLQAN
jgi:hypothetical protein